MNGNYYLKNIQPIYRQHRKHRARTQANIMPEIEAAVAVARRSRTAQETQTTYTITPQTKTPPPLMVYDPDIYRLAAAIVDRLSELTDLTLDGGPRNRARWNALIDCEEQFKREFQISAVEYWQEMQ